MMCFLCELSNNLKVDDFLTKDIQQGSNKCDLFQDKQLIIPHSPLDLFQEAAIRNLKPLLYLQ